MMDRPSRARSTHRLRSSIMTSLLVVSPDNRFVAVSNANKFDIYDHSTGALVSLQGCQHTGCIRAMSFDANSTFFAVSGDDKLVLVWDVATWNVRASLRHVKKVSALVFTPSQLFVADRFGDVVAFPLPANLAEANAVELKEEPRSSFGHFSQVTSMIQGGSIDRPVLITGDVDTRIRVCRFPHTFDIVSMCLGNEKFISALVKLSADRFVSASGDGLLCVWDIDSGRCISSYDTMQMIAPHAVESEHVDSVLQQSTSISEVTDEVLNRFSEYLRAGYTATEAVVAMATDSSTGPVPAPSNPPSAHTTEANLTILNEGGKSIRRSYRHNENVRLRQAREAEKNRHQMQAAGNCIASLAYDSQNSVLLFSRFGHSSVGAMEIDASGALKPRAVQSLIATPAAVVSIAMSNSSLLVASDASPRLSSFVFESGQYVSDDSFGATAAAFSAQSVSEQEPWFRPLLLVRELVRADVAQSKDRRREQSRAAREKNKKFKGESADAAEDSDEDDEVVSDDADNDDQDD